MNKRFIRFKEYTNENGIFIWRGEFSYSSEKEYQKARKQIKEKLSIVTKESNIDVSTRIPDLKKGIVIITLDENEGENTYFRFIMKLDKPDSTSIEY